ncbi:hypothetical protein OSCT_2999 [Oscillochloris trichoides DG-6]|uniref:Uncharacterized protein n=1 Tax=Oscillochloris trichoides DG-6 TaxID=765420 RepID=E1II48_9CHLR|nr:hypothetical protein [Oscillochloris trichoides]EFO79166.1 hypothetical protein OSCT_2999 [Oscillochloris trichoides DG-6]
MATMPHIDPTRPLRQTTYEIEISLVALGGITGLYLWFSRFGTPAASGLVGHSIGIIGFVLMLATETLYSLRKHTRTWTYGRLSTWLQWHIVTGIVGSYMVLLHSAWQFRGIAGVVVLLTAVVVLSGVVGRYFYTAIPRTLDGTEMGLADLETQLAAGAARLEILTRTRTSGEPAPALELPALETPQGGPLASVLVRPLITWRDRAALERAMQQIGNQDQATVSELRRLMRERQRLLRQIERLDMARRLLALWHTVHVPLGVALFIMAFVHVGGAIYYATLLRL